MNLFAVDYMYVTNKNAQIYFSYNTKNKIAF